MHDDILAASVTFKDQEPLGSSAPVSTIVTRPTDSSLAVHRHLFGTADCLRWWSTSIDDWSEPAKEFTTDSEGNANGGLLIEYVAGGLPTTAKPVSTKGFPRETEHSDSTVS